MQVQKLSAKQRAAVKSATRRLNIWEGSVRSGKTFSSFVPWLRHVIDGPEGPLALVGKTERTAKHNVIDQLTEMLGPKRCHYVQGRGELELCGRVIYVVGANDERAEEKIRGKTLAGTYVDEASILPESFWRMLLSRLSVTGARLFATTNPDSPTHWLKRDYLDRPAVWIRGDGEMILGDEQALDLARFSFRLADNETLSPEFIAALERENTGLWRRRFVLGEWVAAEGAIYDMLDVTAGGRHIVTELPELHDLRLAIDYGTTNPFVALLMGVSAEPRLYVAREWRWDSRKKHRQLTDAEYAREVGNWIATGCGGYLPGLPVPIGRVVVDPSAASFRAAWKSHFGQVTHPASNAVEDGIREEASLLAGGLLAFHESCAETIAEHSGYVWDPKATERGEDEPLKAADHGPDACRYGVRSYRTTWRRWLRLPAKREEAA
jgi:PBSX family phage terminase large subunit